MRLVAIVFVFIATPLISQERASYNDTLMLSGKSLAHLSQYASYWIDQNDSGLDSAAVALMRGDFKHWDIYTTLNLGLNPYPLWLSLNVKNIYDRRQTYWWSLYSHADSVILYRKVDQIWTPIDTASYATYGRDRPVPVRFLATRIDLDKGESSSLLMKVRNLRRPQNAVTDITTPAHNLLWEKKFFWTIGFFIGGLALLGFLNLVLGVVSREQIFFLLSLYIVIVSVVVLQEELLLSFYPGSTYFQFLLKLSPVGLTIIGCWLHYMVIDYALVDSRGKRARRILKKINHVGLSYGIAYLLVFLIFYDSMTLNSFWYELSWHIGIFMILSMMVVFSLNVLVSANSLKQLLIFIPVTTLIFFFSAPSYFLNYEGILPYYAITYPNYFYWILCVEFVAFGVLIGWRYRSTLQKNYTLEQERVDHQNELYERELFAQDRERKQISRDLHDDLGATISAIKLIITNSYKKDEHLVKMVNKASNDLRFFISNFSVSDVTETGFFQAVDQKIDELNNLGATKFSFIRQGEATDIPEELQLTLYRIISELLNNILKHSKASSATLQIMIEDQQIQIISEDNGIGFNTSISYEGMGLDNIHMRTKRYQGNVHMVSDRRSGTTTIITIPFGNGKAN